MSVIPVVSFLSWQRCKVWNNSVALWSDALQKYPRSDVAYNNRAIAYFDKGEYEKAIEDCTRAIQLTPNHYLAYFNRGCAYSKKGDYAKAASDFKQYLKKSGLKK
jgi:tetratricopeptide (TPR) repeat protein